MDDRPFHTQLTQEQTDTLITFQSLSGLDDLEQCRQILERNEWDISRAVQDMFEEPRRETPIRDAGENARIRRNNDLADRNLQLAISPSSHVVYDGGPAPVEQWGLYDWIKAAVAFPFRFIFTSLFDVFKFFWSFVSGPRFAPNTSTEDVQSFVHDFEEKYGPQHPVFYRGGYKEAYADAKKELRFLLIYLHEDGQGDSDRFCSDTLVDPAVISLINQRTLFWGCSTKYAEGYKVAQVLKADKYPSLGLVASKNGQMTLVGRIHSYQTSEQLIGHLKRLFSSNEGYLNIARQERQTLDLNQNLRREQDEAYQRSLAADQDKARKKREEETRKDTEARRAKELVERRIREETEREENRIRRKEHAATLLPVEPTDGSSDACRVSIKLPSGKRLERRFRRTDGVKDLYNFVLCQPDAPEHFEVYTSYPRKSIQCSPDSQSSLDSIGLGSTNVFIVEEKDLESDAEQP